MTVAGARFQVECRNGYTTHVKTDDKSAAESWVRVLDSEATHAVHSCTHRPHRVVDTERNANA